MQNVVLRTLPLFPSFVFYKCTSQLLLIKILIVFKVIVWKYIHIYVCLVIVSWLACLLSLCVLCASLLGPTL
jgi:hypothetical protein